MRPFTSQDDVISKKALVASNALEFLKETKLLTFHPSKNTVYHEIRIFEFDFLATRGHQKIFRCDFRILHSRNRGIRFENKKTSKFIEIGCT